MKILIVGFEPGRSLIHLSHQIEMITATFRDLAKSSFKKVTEEGVSDIPQVITYVVQGGLSRITNTLAKAQIEVLKPDAVLFITDKSQDGEYMVAKLASFTEEESFHDNRTGKEGTRKTLPMAQMEEIQKYMDRSGHGAENTKVNLSSVDSKYEYLHRLRCYCQGRIAWVEIPPPDPNHLEDYTQINRSVSFVLGAYHGLVNYVKATEEAFYGKDGPPSELTRNTSTDLDMIKAVMDGNLAMFNVKQGITEFIPAPFDYNEYDSVFRTTMQHRLDEEKRLSLSRKGEEAALLEHLRAEKFVLSPDVEHLEGLDDEEKKLEEEAKLTEQARLAEEATVAEIERLAGEASSKEEHRLLEERLNLLIDESALSESEDSEGYESSGSEYSEYVESDDESWMEDDLGVSRRKGSLISSESSDRGSEGRLSVEFVPTIGKLRIVELPQRTKLKRGTSVEFDPLQTKIQALRDKFRKKYKQRHRRLSTDFGSLQDKIKSLQETTTRRPRRPLRRKMSVEFNPIGDKIKNLMNSNAVDIGKNKRSSFIRK